MTSDSLIDYFCPFSLKFLKLDYCSVLLGFCMDGFDPFDSPNSFCTFYGDNYLFCLLSSVNKKKPLTVSGRLPKSPTCQILRLKVYLMKINVFGTNEKVVGNFAGHRVKTKEFVSKLYLQKIGENLSYFNLIRTEIIP